MKIKINRIITIAIASIAIMMLANPCFANNQSTGILNVQSSPTGAAVFIDGQKKGETPLLIEVVAKAHEISLEFDGYEPAIDKVEIKKNKVHRTNIALKKEELVQNTPQITINNNIKIHKPEPSSEPGTIFLITTPQSLTAFIDDFKISQNTPVAFDIKPGIYELILKNEKSDIVYRKTLFVRSGKTLNLDVIVRKKRTIDYTDPWR